MSAPLDGVIVVALEQAVAAPLATRHLADLGATVLKVERPGVGDFSRSYDTKMNGESTFFVWANRGKQSIELDLKVPADRATFDALVAGADVFVQNLSAAAGVRAAVDAVGLHALHPHLIACEITGYGRGGPRTDDKAYDLAIQAEAGAMALTGSADQLSKVGFSAADISAAMYALSSILAALYRRSVTGEGAAISLSMLECLTEWTAPAVYSAAHTGVVPERAGHRHALIAPYGLYELGDGGSVLVAVQSNPEWASFATTVLGDPALVDDPRFVDNEDRIANVEALELEIERVFGTLDRDAAARRLTEGRIAWSQVRDPIEVWNHEQLAARDRRFEVEHPTGTAAMLLPPFNISGLPDPSTSIPALGEHDRSLVDEIRHRRRP
ncbi:MAG: CaiB/BaiF CoA-transferase family protein [Ilumatobacteraceae bacterium]|nr:CaiB/BaiF CoA-transferase family protein [Ilumatobacteraceae bacterium]